MRSTWESSNYITNQQPIAASPTMLGIAERSSSLRRGVIFWVCNRHLWITAHWSPVNRIFMLLKMVYIGIMFNRPLIRSHNLEMQFKYCKVNDRKNLYKIHHDVLL